MLGTVSPFRGTSVHSSRLDHAGSRTGRGARTVRHTREWSAVNGESPLGRIRAWISSPVSAVGFALALAVVAMIAAWALSTAAQGISARSTDNRLRDGATTAHTLLAERIDAAAGRAAAVAGSP